MANGFKTGGRQKGSSNKLTGTVKEMILQLVTKELQQLPSMLNHMDPKEKAEYILKLLPYMLPKIAPTEEIAPKPEMRLHKLFELEMAKRNQAK